MARNRDYDDEYIDDYEEIKKTPRRKVNKKKTSSNMENTQDIEPVKRYSEADYRFDEDDEYDDEYDEYDTEEGFFDTFTRKRMMRLTSVFAGLVVIILVVVALFVHGNSFDKTLSNVNDVTNTPTSISSSISKVPNAGSHKGEVQYGCLNITIIPGYIRPDSSIGGGGNTNYNPGHHDDPEVFVTPTPVITDEPTDTPTPEVTVDPENPEDTPTPEVTVDPENPEDTPTPEITGDPVDTPTPETPVDTPTPETPVDTPAPVDPVDTPAPNTEG